MADVSVSPPDLKFRFELKKQIPVTLSIQNHGDTPVAFKVKTTSPKKYIVRPSTGQICAKGVFDVQVIMQPQKEPPADLKNCKDKFLVQTVAMHEMHEASPELFDRANAANIKDIKMKVIMLAAPGPPSPVPEMEERDAEPFSVSEAFEQPEHTENQGFGFNDVDPDEFRKKLQQVETEKASLQHELHELHLQHENQAKLQSDPNNDAQFRGFTLLHLLLTAIFCFLMGHYT